MKLRKTRRAFTIVELVIVVAVIGVLAAVLIPTFVNLTNKANKASDNSLVANLNTALAGREGEADDTANHTMQDAIDDLEVWGYKLTNLVTKSKEKLLWNEKTNRFLLEDDQLVKNSSTPEQFWQIADSIPSTQKFSLLAGNKWNGTAAEGLTVGFDIGTHKEIQTVSYIGTNKNVSFRTVGGKLNIGTSTARADGQIYAYGTSDKVTVYTANNCFHSHSVISYMDLKEGKAIAGKSSVIYLMEAEAGTTIVEEDDGVVIIPTSVTTANIKTTNLPEGYVVTESGTTQPADIASKVAENQGLLGSGTELDPFQIYDFETMQAVSLMYETGYHYFKVNIERTNNGSIDCTGWVPVSLHGSFDGNGVNFLNVTACLFQRVGYQLNNENITLKDFDATMNVSANGQYGAAALIKNIFNAGVTTFNNVDVHGYLEGYWNMGSYYNYGTANYDDVGSDYEVHFIDCLSDVTLVCASGNTIGGLLGHSYEGNHSFTLRVDNSRYTGTMYLTTTNGKGNKYFGMTSDFNNSRNHFYFDGVEDTFNNGSSKNAGAYTNSVKIQNVLATKGEGGYYIAKNTNATKISVTITAQLTAYDTNNQAIANLSGITMVLATSEINNPTDESTLVLGLFDSISLTNNADEFDAGIEGSTLNVKVSSDANYLTGNIRLQVNQYDSAGKILSAGTLNLAARSTVDGQWVIA